MDLESLTERAEELEKELYALSLAVRDPRTPRYAKGLIVLLAAYAVSPIDLIPDIIPVVGYLDELLLLPAGVALARRLVPEEVVAECRDRAGEEFDAGNARWIAAGLVVLLWVALGVLAVRLVGGWP